MEKRSRLILTFILLISIVAVLYVFTDWFSKTTGYFIGEDPDIKLAKCLNKKGIILYGSESCPDCILQVNLFGAAFKNLNYIDCSKSPAECAALEKIPAWNFNNKIYYGIISIDRLKLLSECSD